MGTMALQTSQLAAGAGQSNGMNRPDGKLYVPPAYIQTSGDQAVPLASANHKCAFAFTPEVDFALSSLSVYKNAVADADAVLAMNVHEDDLTAIEPNGLFNVSTTNAMQGTAAATSQEVGFEASKAIDGSNAGDNGWRSTAAPSAGSPQDYIIDFGVGASLVINRIQIFSLNNPDADVRAYPKDFTIAFDQNDDSWQTVITATEEPDPGPGAPSNFLGVNGTGYRRMRVRITDRNGVNAYCSVGEIKVFAAQEKAVPGTLLQSLGTKVVGTGSGWLRHTFSTCQLQRGKRYWIQFTGQEGKSFSLSSMRWNTNEGSMFPDSVHSADGDVALKTTSDGGATWTGNLQEDKPAMLNVVLNSTPNHSPQLHYGRHSGQYVYLPGSGIKTIPGGGVALNLEAKSPDVTLNVWFNEDGTLSADTEPRVVNEGVEVKFGSPTSRFLGIVRPVERQPGLQAPIDTEDRRLLRDAFQNVVFVGKRCPYSDFGSVQFFAAGCWQEIGANSPADYTIEFLALPGDSLDMDAPTAVFMEDSPSNYVALGLDGPPFPYGDGFRISTAPGLTTFPAIFLDIRNKWLNEGHHVVTPYFLYHQGNQGLQFMRMSLAGTLRQSQR